MMKPRIKICCISSPDETKTAIEFGASAIDVCSGVRTNGKLDKYKLEKFFFEAFRN